MQNDIFKGKIQKQYYGYVKFTIILVSILFFVIGIFILLVALFYEKVEQAARIFMYVLSSLSILESILYPILTILAIKIYPKHTKLAYSMLREFVFETAETKIINNYKEFGKLTAADFPISYELTTDNIINHIPSKEIRNYLLKNKKKLSIMQYATLVENYYKGNMVAVFEGLREFSNDAYEKELFTIAMKDYRKYKHVEQRTNEYYSKNDPRTKKPYAPFEEFIYLPTLFKEYEIALYLADKPKIVLIGRAFEFVENDDENNANYDFSDLSYMVYDLNTPIEINEENLVRIHIHAHYCELEKIKKPNLTYEQLENCNKLIEVLKKYNEKAS